jgi:hypothetical protein
MGRFISASTFTTEIVNVNTTPYTATSGRTYLVDTTSTAITINIPSADTANVGDRISIVDPTGNWRNNFCTVGVNTATTKIANLNETLVLNIPNNAVDLLYTGSQYGWVLLNA